MSANIVDTNVSSYCGLTDTFDAIAGSGEVTMKKSGGLALMVVIGGRRKNHYAECNYYPLPCPNECGVRNIKRRLIVGFVLWNLSTVHSRMLAALI